MLNRHEPGSPRRSPSAAANRERRVRQRDRRSISNRSAGERLAAAGHVPGGDVLDHVRAHRLGLAQLAPSGQDVADLNDIAVADLWAPEAAGGHAGVAGRPARGRRARFDTAVWSCAQCFSKRLRSSRTTPRSSSRTSQDADRERSAGSSCASTDREGDGIRPHRSRSGPPRALPSALGS